MAKILALGAFGYQAALALGLLVFIARILPPEDYSTYSLFVAATQFISICCFEWIRFAVSRFYPGPSAETEAVQRQTILVEFLICASLCAAGGLGTAALGLPVEVALLGAPISVLQGGSDLQLTMLRFRGRFQAFSMFQVTRATILAVGTLAGAVLGKTVLAAMLGVLIGYVAYAAVTLVVQRKSGLTGWGWDKQAARKHLIYGSVSAGASVLGLLAPLGLRVILTSTLGQHAAAGALLAIDLLQRPFVLVVSALHAIQYPEVVTAYDQGPREDLATRLGRYYALLVTFAILMGGPILVILRPVELLVIRPELRDAFISTAPLLVALFMVRAVTQTVSTTPAHLQKDLTQLMVLAAADCIGLNALAYGLSQWSGASAFHIVLGATLGGLLFGLLGLRMLFSLPFKLPGWPVAIAAAGLAVPGAMLLTRQTASLEGVAFGGVAAVASTVLALYFLYGSRQRPAAV